jgi:hypothetical protein
MSRNLKSIEWHQKTYQKISWDYSFERFFKVREKNCSGCRVRVQKGLDPESGTATNSGPTLIPYSPDTYRVKVILISGHFWSYCSLTICFALYAGPGTILYYAGTVNVHCSQISSSQLNPAYLQFCFHGGDWNGAQTVQYSIVGRLPKCRFH